jgi:hypothetical protein
LKIHGTVILRSEATKDLRARQILRFSRDDGRSARDDRAARHSEEQRDEESDATVKEKYS